MRPRRESGAPRPALLYDGDRLRDLWEVAADLIDPPASPASGWWLPNPDPSVTDPERLDALGYVKGRARPKQRPPEGSWYIWVYMGGRGTGKSRTGGEWINREALKLDAGDQVLIAGRTPADVRDYALHGPGGLLTHHPEIAYEPANRLLLWPNGVKGLIRSGANPEEFRGFSGSKAWLDEFAAWSYPRECWDNLRFGTREANPQIMLTTTPRPIEVLREILRGAGVALSHETSLDNRGNLSPIWFQYVIEPLLGTRLGRQEIEGELLEDTEGALWTLALIDGSRVKAEDLPELKRIAVGVDPQGTRAPGHETGIVVAGLGTNDHLYTLADSSINGSPAEWGAAAVAAYRRFKADVIVGEVNYGGEMVEQTIRVVDPNASFKMVSASRGKRQRAEPIAAVYERGRAHHVGSFVELENEMSTFTPEERRSPNRMDALVWAATELLEPQAVKPSRATWGRPSKLGRGRR